MLLKRGAEADIYQTIWSGSKAILKIRRPKSYRNPVLDSKIRLFRTVKEAQVISKVKSFGVAAPLVYFLDTAKSAIYMQYISGSVVSALPNPEIVRQSKKMGRITGMLHKNGITHGDLTTSNFILHKKEIFIIDFGLAQSSARPEDHAVDLRLIKEILNSAHAQIMQPCWKNFLSGYKGAVSSARCARILDLVSDIEGRGRYATVV